MSKLSKLIKKPHLFLRDYLIKKYPLSYNERKDNIEDEEILIKSDLTLLQIDINEFSGLVDVVVSWVNGSDPIWLAKFSKYSKNLSTNIHKNGTNQARFDNHGELFYVLQSILYNIPWVNKIYIITDKQTPNFDLPKNTYLIDHDQLIDAKYLPTFNSHIIEAHLHKIPNLSERFIYFNDDVFVARPLPKNHFFCGNGISSLFINNKKLDEMISKGIQTPTLSACLNSRALLLNKYNKIINNPLVHTYIPLRKEYFIKAWEEFPQQIDLFLKNRFRSVNDLNLATFLVPWMMYLEKDAILVRDICYYFNIRSNVANTYYNILLKMKENNRAPHSICANDFLSNNKTDFKNNLLDFLESYFNLS